VALNKLGMLCVLLAVSSGCAKKEVKPLHTEPWLAHPAASASLGADAAVPSTRYAIGAQSQARFELPSKHGALHGSFTRVTGELTLTPGDLAQSRGHVEVDLSSLTLSVDGAPDEDAGAFARAESALGVLDAGIASANFELTSLEDVSPAELEPAPERDGGTFTRRARAMAVGNLLLHGFRVVRRAPLEAEFSFNGDPRSPATVLIRSRSPFVISLETHQISVREAKPAEKSPKRALPALREARVSVELYGAKIE
jgi:hypothetical protein